VRIRFLNTVRSTDHVVHSDASGEQNVDTLFIMLGWDWYGFKKKHDMTRYAELVHFESYGICGSCSAFWCIRGMKRQTCFSCSSGTGAYSTKSAPRHITPNLCFCFWWDLCHVVHSSAFRARNVDVLFFLLGWDRYRFDKKRTGTHYAERVFCIRWDLRVT
jgi:hypothetical protein